MRDVYAWSGISGPVLGISSYSCNVRSVDTSGKTRPEDIPDHSGQSVDRVLEDEVLTEVNARLSSILGECKFLKEIRQRILAADFHLSVPARSDCSKAKDLQPIDPC